MLAGEFDTPLDNLLIQNYQVTKFEGKELEIQLNFTSPGFVSFGPVKDTLKVLFTNTTLFVSTEGIPMKN